MGILLGTGQGERACVLWNNNSKMGDLGPAMFTDVNLSVGLRRVCLKCVLLIFVNALKDWKGVSSEEPLQLLQEERS